MTDRDALRAITRWTGRYRCAETGQIISRATAQRMARAARQSDRLAVEILFPVDGDALTVAVRSRSEALIAAPDFQFPRGTGV